MAGVEIKISIDDKEAQDLLGRIQRNLGNLKPAMEIIGETVQTSIQRNFEKGGRPKKWKGLSETTKKERQKKGKWPGLILVRSGVSGGLMGSISYRALGGSVILSANKKSAATHQFGAKKGSFGTIVANVRAHLRKGRTVRAHTRTMRLPWGDIPARPFMMVQDEDWSEIRHALVEFIAGSK